MIKPEGLILMNSEAKKRLEFPRGGGAGAPERPRAGLLRIGGERWGNGPEEGAARVLNLVAVLRDEASRMFMGISAL